MTVFFKEDFLLPEKINKNILLILQYPVCQK